MRRIKQFRFGSGKSSNDHYTALSTKDYRLLLAVARAGERYWVDPQNVPKICAFAKALKRLNAKVKP